jgi:hypothetical protein
MSGYAVGHGNAFKRGSPNHNNSSADPLCTSTNPGRGLNARSSSESFVSTNVGMYVPLILSSAADVGGRKRCCATRLVASRGQRTSITPITPQKSLTVSSGIKSVRRGLFTLYGDQVRTQQVVGDNDASDAQWRASATASTCGTNRRQPLR